MGQGWMSLELGGAGGQHTSSSQYPEQPSFSPNFKKNEKLITFWFFLIQGLIRRKNSEYFKLLY